MSATGRKTHVQDLSPPRWFRFTRVVFLTHPGLDNVFRPVNASFNYGRCTVYAPFLSIFVRPSNVCCEMTFAVCLTVYLSLFFQFSVNISPERHKGRIPMLGMCDEAPA